RLQRLAALASDALERGGEGAPALRVAREHVNARAGGAHEHRLARTRAGGRHPDRLVEAAGAQDLDARGIDRLGDALRVAPDQHDAACAMAHGVGERREVLPLAVATGDQPAGTPDALDRRDGGGNVRALAVVVVLDAFEYAEQLAAVRLATIVPQAVQHPGHGHADRAA